jgi:hypothetical protein
VTHEQFALSRFHTFGFFVHRVIPPEQVQHAVDNEQGNFVVETAFVFGSVP